jgi:hypothetical protein
MGSMVTPPRLTPKRRKSFHLSLESQVSLIQCFTATKCGLVSCIIILVQQNLGSTFGTGVCVSEVCLRFRKKWRPRVNLQNMWTNSLVTMWLCMPSYSFRLWLLSSCLLLTPLSPTCSTFAWAVVCWVCQWCLFFCFCKKGSHYVAQIGLELMVPASASWVLGS